MTNNYLQSTTQKPEYSGTRTQQKSEVNSDSPEVQAIPAPLVENF
jgi:hypothetical protein